MFHPNTTRSTGEHVILTFVKPMSQVKKNCCLYCGTSQQRIARHLEDVHGKKEPEVTQACSHPKQSKERRAAFEILRNRGNYLHNKEVMDIGEGEIVVERRSKDRPESIEAAALCPYCFGLFGKQTLHRYVRRCPKKDSEVKGKHHAPLGFDLLNIAGNPELERFVSDINWREEG
jgi:hypothetical protein